VHLCLVIYKDTSQFALTYEQKKCLHKISIGQNLRTVWALASAGGAKRVFAPLGKEVKKSN